MVQTLVKSSDETVQVPGASSLALLCNSRYFFLALSLSPLFFWLSLSFPLSLHSGLCQTLYKSTNQLAPPLRKFPTASHLPANRTLHAQLLELGVLQTLFVLVMSKHEATRVQAAKALSHLAHESEARAKMLSHQPLVKILSSQVGH